VAVHESGHALLAALCPHADPIAKVTILPAGMALGATEQLPEAERHLYHEDYLTDLLTVKLGGRAAELLFLGGGSTGAANDLAGATQIATRMVREFGLSPALGPVGYATGTPHFLGEEPDEMQRRPYSEATQRTVDSEVARLLREAQDRAMAMLRGHDTQLRRLAELLEQQETIDGDVVIQVLADHPPAQARAGTGPTTGGTSGQ
jgi:cell division protease FtsH